jgi:co-chaperonin GroES (HSP10)
MLNRLVFSLLVTALFAGLLLAHGDPMMGTVTAVGPDTVTIKDKDNKGVIIMVEKTTKFLMNDKPAKKTDVKVGDRVVIDAEMNAKMKMYVAEEINVGKAANARPKKPADHADHAAPAKP